MVEIALDVSDYLQGRLRCCGKSIARQSAAYAGRVSNNLRRTDNAEAIYPQVPPAQSHLNSDVSVPAVSSI